MLPSGSGTLPHRPWTPMSLVNGRSPQAKRCGRDEAKRKSVRKRLPLRGSRCVCNVEELAAPVKLLRHHREAATAREGAKHHREAAPQRKAKHHRDEQRAEPAASRRATCRTDTIEKQLPPGKAHGTSGSNSTAQSTASSRGNCRHGGRDAASGRATCRTSSIGTSNLPN